MQILQFIVLLSIFLSLAFNFNIIEGSLFFSNLIALFLSVVIFLNLKIIEINKEKRSILVLLIGCIFILINMQSIYGLKWLYLIIIYFSYYVYFKYYHLSTNLILLTYAVSLSIGAILSFNFVDPSLLGYNLLSDDFRGSIDVLGGYNTFGVLAAIGIIIFFHFAQSSKNISIKLIYILGIILLFYALISTLSRGGFVSFFLGFLFYNILSKSLRTFIYFLLPIVLFISIFIFSSDIDITGLINRYTFFEDATGSGRTVLWSYILSSINNPINIIFGHGAGSLGFYTSVTEGLSYSLFETSHNTYLDILYEFGMIGITVFMLFIYRIYLKLQNIEDTEEYKILITIFLVIFLSMFFDSYMGSLQISAIFSLFFALLSSERKHA